jgi:hypothetical protein
MRTVKAVLLLVALAMCTGSVACAPRPQVNVDAIAKHKVPAPVFVEDLPIWYRAQEKGYQAAERGTRSIPAIQGAWTDTQWRYYEFADAIASLRSFYREEMPKKGWTRVSWVDERDGSLSYWTKNEGRDGAMVWMTVSGRGTFVATARSRK